MAQPRSANARQGSRRKSAKADEANREKHALVEGKSRDSADGPDGPEALARLDSANDRDGQAMDAAEVARLELKADVTRAQIAAREALADDDIEAAIAYYSDAISAIQDTEHPRWKAKLLLRRARAQAMRGAMYQCADDAARAAGLEPKMQKAYLLQGHALLATQQYGPASECFRRGLNDHPHDAALRTGFEEALRRIQSSRHSFACNHSATTQLDCLLADLDASETSDAEDFLLQGLAVDLSDVYTSESKLMSARGVDQDPYDRIEENQEILGFLHRARVELFTLFCAYLGFPRDAPDATAALQQLQDMAAGPYASARTMNRRALDITNIAAASSSPDDVRPRRIPLGRWTRMSEEGFYRFAERHFLTETFGETHVAAVWARIAQTRPDSPRGGGETIGFPKFLEGIARLACRRYHARSTDRTERTPRILPISRRLFFAFDKHVLASSAAHAAIEQERARARVYLRTLRADLFRGRRVMECRAAFEPRLLQVFDYFKPASEEAMTMAEVLEMALRIKLVDKRGFNLTEIKDTAVAVSMFAGDMLARTVSFGEFVDIIIAWCDALTRNGDIVGLARRLETFFSERIIKPAQRHADLRLEPR